MPSRPKFVPAGAGRPPRRKTTSERGYGAAHQRHRKRVLAERPVCERCNAAFSCHLHHIDRDPFNRADSNVLALCLSCHDAEHDGDHRPAH